MTKPDDTQLRNYKPGPVWSALFKREAKGRKDWELTCWTVVIGDANGPDIPEATALAIARKMLETNDELTALCAFLPGEYWKQTNIRNRKDEEEMGKWYESREREREETKQRRERLLHDLQADRQQHESGLHQDKQS